MSLQGSKYDIPKLSAVEWYDAMLKVPKGLYVLDLSDDATALLRVFGEVLEANDADIAVAARAYGYHLWDHGYTDCMKATKEVIRVRDAAIGLVALSLMEGEG